MNIPTPQLKDDTSHSPLFTITEITAMKTRSFRPIHLLGLVTAGLMLAAPAASLAAFVTWNPSSADASVVAADLDADTTGPASWSITKTADIDRVANVANAGGTDFGFAMDDSDGTGDNPAPSYVELTFDSAVDFSSTAVTVSFDMIYGRSGADKELQMVGFNGASVVFRYTWDPNGSGDNPLIVDEFGGGQSTMSTNYGAFLNSSGDYDPSKLSTFTVTLDGSQADTLVYGAEGLASVSTDALNGNTSLTSVRWGITTDGDAAGFWLDNVDVSIAIPEPASLSVGLIGLTFLCLRRRK